MLSEPCLSACISNWFTPQAVHLHINVPKCTQDHVRVSFAFLDRKFRKHTNCEAFLWLKKQRQLQQNLKKDRIVQSQTQVTYVSIQQRHCRLAGGFSFHCITVL